MRKTLLIILLLILCFPFIAGGQEVKYDVSVKEEQHGNTERPDNIKSERKKVGVVLSGGGAKGFAHIGVLKVLEEAGIPIDYIAGTSMGAVVGGLYSLGYSADMIDSLIQKQDWDHLMRDIVDRKHILTSQRGNHNRYVVSLPY